MDGLDRIPVSTALRKSPSGFTDEQRAASQRAYEAKLFRERRKLVVSEEDCTEIIVLAWFKALAKKRFG